MSSDPEKNVPYLYQPKFGNSVFFLMSTVGGGQLSKFLIKNFYWG